MHLRGDSLSFCNIAAGHDHMPTSLNEGIGCIESYAGGCACDNHTGTLSGVHGEISVRE